MRCGRRLGCAETNRKAGTRRFWGTALWEPFQLKGHCTRTREACARVAGIPDFLAIARDFDLAVLPHARETEHRLADFVSVLFARQHFEGEFVALHGSLQDRRTAVIEVYLAGQRRPGLHESKSEVLGLTASAHRRAPQPDAGDVRGG